MEETLKNLLQEEAELQFSRKGTGLVGTITVSGLAQEEDHRLVVETIRTYLQNSVVPE